MGNFRRILRRGSLVAVLTCSPLAALAAEAEPGRYSSVDTIWILLGAALVFFLQPGFAMLETSLTRAKNAGNIVMKNFMDFALGTVFFWFLGFGLMFGTDFHGIIGIPDPFVQNFHVADDAGFSDMAFLIFQTVFCATSATLGMFILWFGWFGFNGCSTVSMTGDETLVSASMIFVTTNMAAAAGACTAMIVTWIHYGKPDVSMTLNGGLAGLVAITAGCDAVSVTGAFIIGVISGAVIIFLIEFIDQKLKIDDPVGAVAAHGGCGALGTILTGLFSVKDGLLYTGETHFFLIQVLGVCVVALYVFVAINIVFRILNATMGLRVTAEEEINGLDFEEHGIASAYAGFMITPDTVTQAIDAGKAPADAVEVPLDKPESAPSAVTVMSMPADGHHLYNVTIITDEKRFEPLKAAMEAIGITGMTITRALGFGIEKGRPEMYRGAKVSAKLLPKVRVEMVVSKISPRKIIDVAKKVLYTGKYGDGKVFVDH